MPPDNPSDSPNPAPRKIKLPHHRLRSLATTLHHLHHSPPPPPPPANPITVVCISDTHCTQPPIPPGDLLLHAGDLSIWGTFSEIQAQLTWLSKQPHKYKVVIAGNHDLLLDREFQDRYPERWEQAMQAAAAHGAEDNKEEHKTAKDLDWGDVIYLQNSTTTLDFPGERKLSIYGSPLTPQHGISAFQHLPSVDVWTGKIPGNADILLTHGPPRGHLDGFKKSGCTFLAKEVVPARPRLVVYGHIHIGYGVEEKFYDGVGKAYEGIMGQWGGWLSLIAIALGVIWGAMLPRRWRGKEKRTTFVNAAVVEGWEYHEVKNEALVMQM